jgi:hypothetical protein
VWHTEDHLRVLLLLLLVETDWNHQEEEEEDTPIMLQQVSTPQSMKHTFKKKKKKKNPRKTHWLRSLGEHEITQYDRAWGGGQKNQTNKQTALACLR